MTVSFETYFPFGEVEEVVVLPEASSRLRHVGREHHHGRVRGKRRHQSGAACHELFRRVGWPLRHRTRRGAQKEDKQHRLNAEGR
jgi:hypothetical protein